MMQPGIHNIDAARYHADDLGLPEPSLSSSGARRIMETCPAQWWYEREHPVPPSTALKVGSAAHEWLLEGDTWPQRHAVMPPDHDSRTKAGKARIGEAWAAGLRVITHDQFEMIKAMHDALAAHEFAMSAFTGGEAEQTLVWRDPEFDVWCRARPDYLKPNMVADYKTAASVAPDHLRRAIANFGYHCQAAWYLDGLAALGLGDRPFLFVCQCKDPPYLIVPVVLDDEALGWGRLLNSKAKAEFARGLRTGVWRGYTEEVIQIGLPGWEGAQLQRRFEAGEFEIGEVA